MLPTVRRNGGAWLSPALILVGALLATLVVSIGATLQDPSERRLLGGWLEVSRVPGTLVAGWLSPRVLLVLAIAGMVAIWVAVAFLFRRTPPSRRLLGLGVVTWTAPFALGPPFMSRDAYAYLAQGELLRRGLDPYRHTARELGQHSHLLTAVDPLWRGTVPPYGPLALRIEELCSWFGIGGDWAGLVALRVLVLISLGLTLLLLRRAVEPARRGLVTWVFCSPLVLLQLVAAMHLEAVVCLLLVATAVLSQRGHPFAAVVMAVVATEVKATVGLVVGLLVLRSWTRLGRRAGLEVAGAALLTAAAAVLLYPADPFGWVAGLRTPTLAWAPFTPSSTLYLALSELQLHLHLPAWPVLKTVCRDLGIGAGVVALVFIVRLYRDRSVAWLAAMTLLVLVLAGPVLWPWYLAPSAVLLLLVPGTRWMAVVLGALPALAALPLKIVPAQRTTVAAELLCGLALLLLHLRRSRRSGHASDRIPITAPAASASASTPSVGAVPTFRDREASLLHL